jgi:hypothetical protein
MAANVAFPKKAFFEPSDITAMSKALADACDALHVSNDAMAEREIVATRIIELARRGEAARPSCATACSPRSKAEGLSLPTPRVSPLRARRIVGHVHGPGLDGDLLDRHA